MIAVSAALFVCSAFAAVAQGYTVKIKLVEDQSGAPVGYATVSLTKEGQESVFKFTQTDGDGKASISGVPAGKYKISGILLGYDNYEENIEVKADVDLGAKKMPVQVTFLEGATVTSVGNPIVVKKDTIEHNVSLMHSSDNDVLEDLLKRLPGVEVNSDGTITANGKTISKIYVDGKQFFLDDPSLASKNLPAKIIDKVKIVEKKSEQAEFTGIDDGEEEMVLDLGIKKGMMNGWFGNIMAGGGADIQGKAENILSGSEDVNHLRYQGAAMVANFTASDQLAIIANANNTNNRGFQDMMASSMGGMRGGGMRGGMGGPGMGRGNGISTSYMLGANGGHTWDNKSELIGNAMFNGNERYVLENTEKTTFKDDGTSVRAVDKGANYTNTYGVRGGARADIKISDATSLLFEPNFNIGWGNFKEISDFYTDNIDALGKETSVNNGNSLSTGDSRSQNANGRLLWRQRLGKPGRTISVNARYQFSNSTIDGYNYSKTETYWDPDITTVSIVDQQYDQQSRSQSANARVVYTEPLGKNFYIEGNYMFNYSQNKSVKNTYDKDENGQYIILDENYSSNVTSNVYRHNAGLNFKKQEDKYNVSVGVSFQPQTSVNERHVGALMDTTVTLKVFNWSPNARVDFNFSDYQMLRLNYWGRSSQPSINQMMPIPDNSNPQKITLGNMSLNPSFSHQLRAMYRSTNTETFASLDANVNFTYNTRSIVNASWIDPSGVQYTVPMNNNDGSTSTNAFVMFNSPIAKSKFSIMSFTNAGFSTGVSFVGNDYIISDDPNSYLDLANYTKNGYRSLNIGENLRFMYRGDLLEVSVNGGTRYSQAWYDVASSNVAPTWTSNVGADFRLNSDIINVSTDARYTFYKGYGSDFNDPTFVWNAEISKQLFKNRFTLAVKAYDILNTAKNKYRTTTDNYVLDTQNNTLGRYIILSLTYRFGTFGGKNGGGQMGPGRMGPGGMGGRGPMGPPPGRR